MRATVRTEAGAERVVVCNVRGKRELANKSDHLDADDCWPDRECHSAVASYLYQPGLRCRQMNWYQKKTAANGNHIRR